MIFCLKIKLCSAGTYANNQTCAVSATGHGEYMIRTVLCHSISCLMEYQHLQVKQASDYAIFDKLAGIGT